MTIVYSSQLQLRSVIQSLAKDPRVLSNADAEKEMCCFGSILNFYASDVFYLLKFECSEYLIKCRLILLDFYQLISCDFSLS